MLTFIVIMTSLRTINLRPKKHLKGNTLIAYTHSFYFLLFSHVDEGSVIKKGSMYKNAKANPSTPKKTASPKSSPKKTPKKSPPSSPKKAKNPTKVKTPKKETPKKETPKKAKTPKKESNDSGEVKKRGRKPKLPFSMKEPEPRPPKKVFFPIYFFFYSLLLLTLQCYFDNILQIN